MNIFDTARNAWRAFTTDDLATMGGGSGPVTSADREIATVTYRVKTAFSGASVGDIVTSTRVLDVAGGTATQVGATIWYNESTAAALSGTPVAANLETAGGTPGLTDAQLRAAALPVSAAALPLPAGASTAALQGTANTSLANIDGKTPVLRSGRSLVENLGVPTVARQLTAGLASSNTVLTVGAARISVYCRIADVRFSIGGVAQVATAAGSHFIAAGERLDFDVPANPNIAIIRADTSSIAGILEITELD